ncbi:MAG: acyl-CoA dehydratase activase [Clostridium sp.]|nr:acyl-CoA dehydratase activase [Clostridium sp.]
MHSTKAEECYLVGIDVGSTTTKVTAADPDTGEIVYVDYRRHNAEQLKSVQEGVKRLAESCPGRSFRAAMTGSGAKPIADAAGIPFIQEVVANALALRTRFREVGTAIELGGQDAKIVFFRKDRESGRLEVDDMRMNGSCAGGTGAFIDEIAEVLRIPVTEFNRAAERGTFVYDISGRCGVYAKTDIQPLLNQGISKEDLALSSFHAIAKQTIGGLAQGLEIRKPVAFEGGPLTFNPVLIRVFKERLDLTDDDVIIPDHPENMVSYGAALSLTSLFSNVRDGYTGEELFRRFADCRPAVNTESDHLTRPFFSSDEEYEAFAERHRKTVLEHPLPPAGSHVRAFLGIDSGSTTTKFVLMDEKEEILDAFYANNEGDPLMVAKGALIALRDRYRANGLSLEIIAAGSTGYGEMLFHRALDTECHVVETVAHARAALKYVKDASFILDIGGQDMKAVWLDNGVVTDIVVNEACSSGCGSFLENFARTLSIPVSRIAKAAFSSGSPAALGSRCTVFMNSSIITEQRNGKSPEDIMAGLCRSIIENVFTKVIRISNIRTLGDRIVVQGGTFENDAVLRAMEQYIGKEVIRSPYPGLMGAIGAALITMERMKEGELPRTFIGLDSLDSFSYTQESNLACPFCGNHCRRTVVRFSNGSSWVTNNRCERGEILGDPKDPEIRKKLRTVNEEKQKTPNLYKLREELLFRKYPADLGKSPRGIRIGIPRVLSFWDTMPFWTTFWRSLGFEVVISPESTRKMYEAGLSAVTSDTICFPAKLVHGHLRTLAGMGANRIFMPSITSIKSENTERTSESMCAVVKGYPIVVRNSDNPERLFGITFDAPLWHWHTDEDRNRQLTGWMKSTFGISPAETMDAIGCGDAAMKTFRRTLEEAGKSALEEAEKKDSFCVVLASRPYQNDPLVNHDLPELFTSMGIPVLTADSVPEFRETDLSRSRLDIVNNYHGRMLSSAILASESPNLEYVQLVSFGCGHDAYLSDEIVRMMHSISGKSPLILKLDESDAQGPLRIRVRSFIETVMMRRKNFGHTEPGQLPDPYQRKFTREDSRTRTVLVPNTSHAFSRIMAAVFSTQGIHAVPLELGREEAIRLGKQYVHNDICFPSQIVIGEILWALRSGAYNPDEVGVAMAKYIGDCRLTHYSALLRKALDDAGYPQVPILTNDDTDYHRLHPGFRMNLLSAMRLAYALPMVDVLEELLRKIRPYEIEKGSADAAFEKGMDLLCDGLASTGIRGAQKGFAGAVRLMKQVKYDRSRPKPTVLIVGEYLLNFHPGANHEIERYLEKNGFEVIEARMADVIRKTYFYQDAQNREYRLKKPLSEKAVVHLESSFFRMAQNMTDSIAREHPLYTPAARMEDMVKESDPVIHHTFDAGEGVLIPGEILHHAKRGCRNFIILQPFGCLPNHVVGRGITRKLKEIYPDARILPLDYDPDVSQANIENRLQMMIMDSKTPL